MGGRDLSIKWQLEIFIKLQEDYQDVEQVYYSESQEHSQGEVSLGVFHFLGDVYYFCKTAERDKDHAGDCED